MNQKSRRGFSIRIFLADGVPDGVRVVEKYNWTGQGIMCPRSRFSTARTRDEFNRTGIYVLLGPLSGEDQPTIYIGEGDPVRPRLESHNSNKDFWTSLVAFTSKDQNLNKAHVQYLESRLITLAHEAKRCVLDNVNSPQLPSLAEADIADMEAFLDEMLLIFPVLGLSAFEKPPQKPVDEHLLYLRGRGIEATGYEAPQGFVVQSGSQAVKDTVPSIHNYMVTLRNKLLEKDILVDQDDHYILSQDYVFDSPSTAAGVLLGRTANGRIEWKDENGVTLKELQSQGQEAENE